LPMQPRSRHSLPCLTCQVTNKGLNGIMFLSFQGKTINFENILLVIWKGRRYGFRLCERAIKRVESVVTMFRHTDVKVAIAVWHGFVRVLYLHGVWRKNGLGHEGRLRRGVLSARVFILVVYLNHW
jgi:hypothetical protein